MAGGYITEHGFVEDVSKKTTPQEAPIDSPCGSNTTIPAIPEPTDNPQDEVI